MRPTVASAPHLRLHAHSGLTIPGPTSSVPTQAHPAVPGHLRRSRPRGTSPAATVTRPAILPTALTYPETSCLSRKPLGPSPSPSPSLSFPPDVPFSASRTAMQMLRYLKHRVGDVEFLLPLYLRATPLGASRRITRDTALVIEGKPRSGNTFAVRATEQAAGGSIIVCSHVHVPSAVARASRRKIPTLVLIRQPIDSICSEKIAAPHASLRGLTKEWAHYYEKIWAYREDFVVATFDQVTTDFGSVIDRVNQRFETALPRFENSAENDDRVFGVIEENHLRVHGDTEHIMPRPSITRRDAKNDLVRRMNQPELRDLLARADGIYQRYAERAEPTAD